MCEGGGGGDIKDWSTVQNMRQNGVSLLLYRTD